MNDLYFCNKHDLDTFMQPVICDSFVSFPRNAKPKVSASFHECGKLRTERYIDDNLKSPFYLAALPLNLIVQHSKEQATVVLVKIAERKYRKFER